MRMKTLLIGLIGWLLAPLGASPAEADPLASGESSVQSEILDDDATQSGTHEPAWSGIPAKGGSSYAAWEDAIGAYADEIQLHLGSQSSEPLAHLLLSLPVHEQTPVLVSWALSPRDSLRLAAARAASRLGRPIVGLPSVIEQLGEDPSEPVRQAAQQARASTHADA